MINDYSTLKAAVADWLKRSDLDSVIPTFIQLAETRVNRTVRTHQMLVQVEGVITGSLSLPANLLQIHSFRVKEMGQWVEIPPMPPEALAEMFTAGGVFGYVVGPDDTLDQTGVEYQLSYYEEVRPLSDQDPQNWLILRQPGLYLYGALIEAYPFLKDDERMAIWQAQYQKIVDEMRISDDYARYGNAPRAFISGSFTP